MEENPYQPSQIPNEQRATTLAQRLVDAIVTVCAFIAAGLALWLISSLLT